MKLIQTQDRLIQQFQSNVQELLDPLENNPLFRGVFLTNIALESGITNIIPTKLNRNVIGYIICRLNVNSVIWDTQDLNRSPTQNLQLVCSANCVVSIYVF